jgi:predicted metalloprotease with PDZ domain
MKETYIPDKLMLVTGSVNVIRRLFTGSMRHHIDLGLVPARRSIRQYRLLCLVVLVVVSGKASFSQCAASASTSEKVLNYSIQPVLTDGKLTLHVTLEFKGGPEGKTELELPSEWAGQAHLEKAVTDLKSISDQTTISDTASPSRKNLRFPPNATVRISYTLVKDWAGPLNSGTRFRAVLEPEYFQVNGNNALVHPEFEPSSIVDVHVDWKELPPQWSVATSFGTDDGCQSFHGAWHHVQDALFAGGDFRIRRIAVADKPLIVATRGKWNFTDDEWISQLQKIIGMERTLWRDNDFPYYLVTLAPLDQERGSTGGTALTNAFMMHLSRLDSLSYVVLSTLAHETFHTWNPYKMGRPGDPGVYWFQEGFTVYYADLILFRGGVLSLPEYIEHTNEKLRDYALLSERNISNADLSARYSKEKSLGKVPYWRGAVLALWLDSKIRRATRNRKSLDTLMLDLVHQASPNRMQTKNKDLPVTTERILRTARKYLNVDSRRRLRQYVELGETIPAPEDALGPCARLQNDMIPKFDLGMDENTLRTKNLVAGVRPDGAAFKAGLRDGQQIIVTSIYWNDPLKPVKLTVRTAEGNRTFEYYPRSMSAVPQYHLDTNAYVANPKACGLDH